LIKSLPLLLLIPPPFFSEPPVFDHAGQEWLNDESVSGLWFNVVKLTPAGLDQGRHAGEPLAELREGEDFGDKTLPLSQAGTWQFSTASATAHSASSPGL
jgi:hypothetical protein